MDEDKIWNFQMTPYNQQAVYNKHIYDPRLVEETNDSSLKRMLCWDS